MIKSPDKPDILRLPVTADLARFAPTSEGDALPQLCAGGCPMLLIAVFRAAEAIKNVPALFALRAQS